MFFCTIRLENQFPIFEFNNTSSDTLLGIETATSFPKKSSATIA
jgi:hypothetical protein